ncbi:MAG: hypothetical protein RID53_09540 [Coleofasciculus sp. B1-GNL1-01]|uniref:hypothetical protein n=1 Tax=Coleofasciculus sp. B1-GNL1-01 TaxID=3068484 RepID=UPI0032F32DF8
MLYVVVLLAQTVVLRTVCRFSRKRSFSANLPIPHHLKFDTHGCADNPTLSGSLSDDAERFLHKNQHS